MTVANLASKTIVFVGDSITRGFGVGYSTSLRWSSLVSQTLNATEDNYGHNGFGVFVSNNGGLFDPSEVPQYNASTHGILISAYGVNDLETSVDNYTAGYSPKIDYLVSTKGWPADRIVILSVWYTSTLETEIKRQSFVDAAQQLSVSKGCYFIDVYTPEKNNPNVATHFSNGDFVHPNATGNVAYKGYVLAGLNTIYPNTTQSPLITKKRKIIV